MESERSENLGVLRIKFKKVCFGCLTREPNGENQPGNRALGNNNLPFF